MTIRIYKKHNLVAEIHGNFEPNSNPLSIHYSFDQDKVESLKEYKEKFYSIYVKEEIYKKEKIQRAILKMENDVFETDLGVLKEFFPKEKYLQLVIGYVVTYNNKRFELI